MNKDGKKVFRKQMLAKRDAIPFENRMEADKLRNERILTWKPYREAELLLFYVSYRSEADTIQLLKQALSEGRNVAVPKVEGTEMVFYRITDFSQLVEGYRGIFEPDTENAVPVTEVASPPDEQSKSLSVGGEDSDMPMMHGPRNGLPKSSLLFVPGCAFDKKGGRMGYGGGFYDRFMETYPELKRVALGFEEQLVEEVPREAHDKSIDVIITEARIWNVSDGVRK